MLGAFRPMEKRPRTNAFLSALKITPSESGVAKKLSSPKLRGAKKRASPSPNLGRLGADCHGAKRPAFTIHGSIESLYSNGSVSDEEVDITESRSSQTRLEDVCNFVESWNFTGAIKPDIDLNNNICEPQINENYAPVPLEECNTREDFKVECAGSKEADRNTCEIYCYGPLLEAAQDAYLYNDSKSFVDMKMKNDSDVVLREFDNLQNSTGGNPTKKEVTDFVNEHFSSPGSEFEDWVPDDWKEMPAFLTKITDGKLKSWASDLNSLWKVLGRKITDDVEKNASRYSMIYSSNPIIIPGGRFREFYYWDNYWIVRGLLLSEMYSTVKGSIRNFLGMVDKFGFVPNGGRIYYTRRSQPPFLTLMVREYVTATGDEDFLAEALPTLEKEYQFWMTNRKIEVNDSEGNTHVLNRYASDVNQPRPESYREDAELVEGLDEVAKLELMSHVTSACESGWDFSTRWTGSCYMNTSDSPLRDLRTRDIIPVDLNSILASVETTLADFHSRLGDSDMSLQYASAYNTRVEAMEKILWNDQDGIYYDYLISQKAHNRQFFASNINPLWTKCYSSSVNVQEREEKIYNYLKKTDVLEFPGGIPTSLNESGEQWDFPNAWPPLVHMIIEGMASSSQADLRAEGLKQAQKWITSNWRAFDKTTAMFEKYDVTRDDGVPGSGGEYDVQTGFGWTNGVVMSLLNDYGDQLAAEPPITSSPLPLMSTTSAAGPKASDFTPILLGAAAAVCCATAVP